MTGELWLQDDVAFGLTWVLGLALIVSFVVLAWTVIARGCSG